MDSQVPDVSFMADPDQIEQMLINLVRNAAEAAIEGAKKVKTEIIGLRYLRSIQKLQSHGNW